eukprot:8882775-Pyramimonas_sp.AAC.1
MGRRGEAQRCPICTNGDSSRSTGSSRLSSFEYACHGVREERVLQRDTLQVEPAPAQVQLSLGHERASAGAGHIDFHIETNADIREELSSAERLDRDHNCQDDAACRGSQQRSRIAKGPPPGEDQ